MESIKYIAVIFLCLVPLIANAETLVSESHEIAVEWKCGEGHVSCDNITFHVKNTAEGTSGTYRGRSMHSLCADGVSPCRFQGYTFSSGAKSYIIHVSGALEVVAGDTVVFSEEGEWHY